MYQAQQKSNAIECRKCAGSGIVIIQPSKPSVHSSELTETVCPICNGSGQIKLHTQTSRRCLPISEFGMLLYG